MVLISVCGDSRLKICPMLILTLSLAKPASRNTTRNGWRWLSSLTKFSFMSVSKQAARALSSTNSTDFPAMVSWRIGRVIPAYRPRDARHCVSTTPPSRLIKLIPQQFVNPCFAARPFIHLLDNHRAIQAIAAVRRRQVAGNYD